MNSGPVVQVGLELVSKEFNHFGGDCVVFPRLGTKDTDRRRINKGFLPSVSVPGAQSRKKDAIPQNDLTPWILTLTFTLLIIFILKSLQKEQNSTNLLLWPTICRNKPAITTFIKCYFKLVRSTKSWLFLPKNLAIFWKKKSESGVLNKYSGPVRFRSEGAEVWSFTYMCVIFRWVMEFYSSIV